MFILRSATMMPLILIKKQNYFVQDQENQQETIER